MKKDIKTLAFDFGASSGRAILGTFDGDKITLKELHRFSNDPVTVNGTMYWDVLRLLFEIKEGLLKTKAEGKIDSIGIDTWGVDFGLLDKHGKLLENPVHYRDARTAGILEKAFEKLPKEEFYQITGDQFMEINTAFQLYSLVQERPEILQNADCLLLMPDLLRYFLTNEKATEYSIASTTQLLDAKQKTWSKRVLDALSIPEKLFTEIQPTATKAGRLSDAICEELGVESTEVIAVAGHDTQCAMAAVPTEEEDFLFLSCGTWSLLGTELSEPILNADAYQCNLTNEGGYGNKASFLKNIIGLWLIQETRRQWKKEGEALSFADMEALARAEEPFQCFIDPDDEVFVPAGNIPKRIKAYCQKTGQFVPETKGQTLRCIYDSLAMKYRYAAEQVEFCTKKHYDKFYIVGGGVQDRLLCETAANVLSKTVVAGPVEATVYGNVLLQLIALSEIPDLKTGRRLLLESEQPKVFTPNPEFAERANKAYEKFKEVTNLC